LVAAFQIIKVKPAWHTDFTGFHLKTLSAVCGMMIEVSDIRQAVIYLPDSCFQYRGIKYDRDNGVLILYVTHKKRCQGSVFYARYSGSHSGVHSRSTFRSVFNTHTTTRIYRSLMAVAAGPSIAEPLALPRLNHHPGANASWIRQ